MDDNTGRVGAKGSAMEFGGQLPRFEVDSFAVGLGGHGRMGPRQQVVVMIGGAPEKHLLFDNTLRLSPETALALGEALTGAAGAVLKAQQEAQARDQE